MCFGSKDDGDDTPAPRPAQQHSPPPQKQAAGPQNGGHDAVSEGKKTQQHAPEGQGWSRPHSGSGAGGAGQSYAPPPGPPPGHYAPPAGPPPGRHDGSDFAPPPGPPPPRGDDYGPPSGPPPGHRDEYAPPSGPPPGQHHHEYAPPSGPPPGHRDEYAPPSGPPPGHGDFSPPPGPPPGQRSNYALPSGPPPGRQGDFGPPSGPPPGHKGDFAPPAGPPPSSQDWIAPPPGPPPGGQAKAPEHAWQDAVPDTSLFPPPPAIFSGFYTSPTSNASEEEAIAGEEWCERYPLTPPMTLDQPGRTALQYHNIRLMEPTGFNGKLNWVSPGRWEGQTANNSRDRCIIGYPPLYLVNDHDPTRTGQPRTIYYEVRLRPDSPTVFLGLGFTALPYPSFRMPGWHRGSLAVHGDDGHKYINDRWGGKSFTDEFRRGDTYGIGMRFQPTGGPRPQVDIFFTRNGKHVGAWDLHEETDAEEDLPVTGLEGFHDLSCAIGTYEGVSFDVIFNPAQWMYKDL